MRGRVTLIGLLQAAATLTVSASLVTAFDSLHHVIELFSHFRLQYMVAAGLLAVGFAVLRSRYYAGLLALAAMMNAAFVLPWYFADAATTSGTPLKILHANVQSSSISYERLIEVVGEESPDIVFLQEVTGAWAAATRALASGYAFHYAEPREGNFGIAMFSRIPLDSVTHVDSPPSGNPTIVAQANVSGRALTLISTHPAPPLGKTGYTSRNIQLEHVADLAAGTSGPTVLVGDLNTTAWSQAYRSLLEDTGLRDARHGFGVLPTWPTFMPFAMIPIDHALVSGDVGVLDVRLGRRIGSDHLPLVVTVQL